MHGSCRFKCEMFMPEQSAEHAEMIEMAFYNYKNIPQYFLFLFFLRKRWGSPISFISKRNLNGKNGQIQLLIQETETSSSYNHCSV